MRLYIGVAFGRLPIMPAAIPIEVTASQQRKLKRIVKAKTSSQRDVFRARIILGLAQGLSHEEIAKEQSVSLLAIGRWRKRWAAKGLEGLQDAPGRGRKPRLSARAVGRALSLARTRAPHGGPWSVRGMASETGLSKSSVQRLWSAHQLQPHRVRDFKLSKDLRFEEKFWDVVGLYLDPPEQALVLCSDEKSACEALERTQHGLTLGQGRIRTRTHDYYRHGTVTLFAALDYLSGKVFAHTAPRHRHQEWLAFLRKIDKEVAPELELHIICDNYSTPKHAKVTAWLKRHPRFHLHFIPTFLLAQSGGTLLWRNHRQSHPPGKLSQRRGFGRRHVPLSRSSQSQSQTRPRLGGHARRDIQSYLRDLTLDHLRACERRTGRGEEERGNTWPSRDIS